jgi:RNA ligase (TIGR02306 family)
MRKLVTLETVVEVRPIPDADAIEAIVIRGWVVVAKRGEFQVGDRCVYFEIDSALPLSDERFAFLSARGTNTTLTGSKVHVLKTARLRGVYSQGLALPTALFPELAAALEDDNNIQNASLAESEDAADFAALLAVEKWEPPMPASMGGDAIGAFPTSLARKTDAERIQNLTEAFSKLRAHTWIATEKIDGTSVTYINDGGTLRVCGRNWELAEGPNVYWEMATLLKLRERMESGWVIQGEIYGEGVQANPLKVRGGHLAVFGMFNNRVPVPLAQWPSWLGELAAPTLDIDFSGFDSVDQLVAAIDGLKSTRSPDRLAEGVVFHTANGEELPELDFRGCFKVISNKYLLKHQ